MKHLRKILNLNNKFPTSYYSWTKDARPQNLFSRRLLVKAGLTWGALNLFLPKSLFASNNRESEKGISNNRDEDSSKLYKMMNLALKHEYGAIVQYTNHAGLISAMLGDKYFRTMQSIIQDEVRHAYVLTRELKRLEENATLAVWPPKSSEDPQDMISQDIAAEEGAVELYAQIMSMDAEERLMEKISPMQAAEKEHREIFSNILEEIS